MVSLDHLPSLVSLPCAVTLIANYQVSFPREMGPTPYPNSYVSFDLRFEVPGGMLHQGVSTVSSKPTRSL